MRAFSVRWSLLFFAVIAGGCASRTVVVLVPDPKGDVGAVSVSTERGSVSL
jgi:hypothetical protein